MLAGEIELMMPSVCVATEGGPVGEGSCATVTRVAVSRASEQEEGQQPQLNGSVKCECGHQRSYHLHDKGCAVCVCTAFVRPEDIASHGLGGRGEAT